MFRCSPRWSVAAWGRSPRICVQASLNYSDYERINQLELQLKKTSETVARTSETVERTSETVEKLSKKVDKLFGGMTTLQGFKSAASTALELEAARGVANFLEGGEVIVGPYTWKEVLPGEPGEMDGLVKGSLHGVDVLVSVEAKYDMRKRRVRLSAVSQAAANRRRIVVLERDYDDIMAADEDDDEAIRAEKMDIEALKIKENMGRKKMIALAGAVFPEELTEEISDELNGEPWLYVHLDGTNVEKVEFISGPC